MKGLGAVDRATRNPDLVGAQPQSRTERLRDRLQACRRMQVAEHIGHRVQLIHVEAGQPKLPLFGVVENATASWYARPAMYRGYSSFLLVIATGCAAGSSGQGATEAATPTQAGIEEKAAVREWSAPAGGEQKKVSEPSCWRKILRKEELWS